MTHPITQREEEIFNKLRRQEDFADGLFRDGAPRPDVYEQQSYKVVFVFREPNLEGENFDLDMRAQVRNEDPNDPLRSAPSARGWWRGKVGAFAHAVQHSMSERDVEERFQDFCALRDSSPREAPVDYLFPFAFMQVKKRGGGGVQHAGEVYYYTRRYRHELAAQLGIYQPDLVVGCGRGQSAPADLIRDLVLPQHFGEERQTRSGFRWWRASAAAGRPGALLEYNHPSARTSRLALYRELAEAVAEIRTTLGS